VLTSKANHQSTKYMTVKTQQSHKREILSTDSYRVQHNLDPSYLKGSRTKKHSLQEHDRGGKALSVSRTRRQTTKILNCAVKCKMCKNNKQIKRYLFLKKSLIDNCVVQNLTLQTKEHKVHVQNIPFNTPANSVHINEWFKRFTHSIGFQKCVAGSRS
jgi:hypothetical protein